MLCRDLWLNHGGTCCAETSGLTMEGHVGQRPLAEPWAETSGLTMEGHVGQRPLAEPWRDMLGRDLWLNPGGTCWAETSG